MKRRAYEVLEVSENEIDGLLCRVAQMVGADDDEVDAVRYPDGRVTFTNADGFNMEPQIAKRSLAAARAALEPAAAPSA